jgi:hypothetical protein
MTWALVACAALLVIGLLVFAWLCALAGAERDAAGRDRRR